MTLTNNNQSCKQCKYYFDLDKLESGGYCRFTAPVIIPQLGHKTGNFPIVDESWWCGEFIQLKPKPLGE